jgi:hypothetical protein
VDFIECLDEVGFLSCLSRIFVYITYLIVELIYVVISVFCGLPLSIERFFLVTKRRVYISII